MAPPWIYSYNSCSVVRDIRIMITITNHKKNSFNTHTPALPFFSLTTVGVGLCSSPPGGPRTVTVSGTPDENAITIFGPSDSKSSRPPTLNVSVFHIRWYTYESLNAPAYAAGVARGKRDERAQPHAQLVRRTYGDGLRGDGEDKEGERLGVPVEPQFAVGEQRLADAVRFVFERIAVHALRDALVPTRRSAP